MIVVGSQFFPAEGDAGRRQGRARAAILALPGVVPINLQFVDEDFAPDGFSTRRVLRGDARTVTGADGRRKPIVSEMFDALAAAAEDHGALAFVYVNADIEVTAAALERLGDLDGCAYSRVDLDPATRAPLGVEIYGIDAFAIRTAWWHAERRRFRPYIAGEACWDNVYAAILCSHGRAEIVTDAPGIFHERHASAWQTGPYAEFNGYLAALDAPYFSRWVAYTEAVAAARAANRPIPRGSLEHQCFSGHPIGAAEALKHTARKIRARARWAAHRF